MSPVARIFFLVSSNTGWVTMTTPLKFWSISKWFFYAICDVCSSSLQLDELVKGQKKKQRRIINKQRRTKCEKQFNNTLQTESDMIWGFFLHSFSWQLIWAIDGRSQKWVINVTRERCRCLGIKRKKTEKFDMTNIYLINA